MAAQMARDIFLDRLPIAVSGVIHVADTKRASVIKCCKNL